MHVYLFTENHAPEPTMLPRLHLFEDELFGVVECQNAYRVEYLDEAGQCHPLHWIRIGEVGVECDRAFECWADIPIECPMGLPARLYTLGVDNRFYQCVAELGPARRQDILHALRDLAYSDHFGDMIIDGPCETADSLLAIPELDTDSLTVVNTPQLSPYEFSFALQGIGDEPVSVAELSFSVNPQSVLPTNVHVLIGRNGVGKTTIFRKMLAALRTDNGGFQYGQWADSTTQSRGQTANSTRFANVVSMSFNAFDAERDNHRPVATGDIAVLPHDIEFCSVRYDAESQENFALAMWSTLNKSCVGLWCNVLTDLSNDPLLAELDLPGVIASHHDSPTKVVDAMLGIYRTLSSGHKSVLLGVTFLVHHTLERSLVLIDEPEAHLHPPLLSAYMRAVERIMRYRNAVSIIATHSPVVVAEVPSNCVHVVHRSGQHWLVKRPRIETFGENVGVLTEEVFGLEVVNTGFHKVLAQACNIFDNYQEAREHLGPRLGSEARAILRAQFGPEHSRGRG